MTRVWTAIDLAVLRNPGFRLLGLGQLGSVTGDQIPTLGVTVSVSLAELSSACAYGSA